MSRSVFLITGEASGDLHAAHLIRELKQREPDLHFYGVGGPRCREAGMEVLVDADSLSVVGLFELWRQADELLGAYKKVRRLIEHRNPDMAILLDLPDFNLKMARHLKRRGIPVTYYISPQVWAWRKGRVSTIRQYVDRMLVIYPFERDFYLEHGVQAQYVGNPLANSVPQRKSTRSQEEVRRAPRIAVLPGSRRGELRMHRELLVQTTAEIKKRYPQAELRIPVASSLPHSLVAEAFAGSPVSVESRSPYEILEWADVALVASGTATLETALVGTPFCMFYRLSPMTENLGKAIGVFRKNVGLVNILLGKDSVVENCFDKATLENCAATLTRLIEDEPYRRSLQDDFTSVRHLLGSKSAAEGAASAIQAALS